MNRDASDELKAHFFEQVVNRPEWERGWLIERADKAGNVIHPAQYVGEHWERWVTDHTLAIRFSRKEDAERAIRLLGYRFFGGDNAIATEHMWS